MRGFEVSAKRVFKLLATTNLGGLRTIHSACNQSVLITKLSPASASKPGIPLVAVCRMSNLAPTKVRAPSQNPAGELHGVIIGDPKTHPRGLIVIHEWWGMNEQIQTEAAEIARDGKFTVFVPDLYRGKVATDNEQAEHYMGNLDWKGAIQDISASAQYLKKGGCSKIGVTGFCMGGALAFASSALCSEISAGSPFYGIPGKEFVDLTSIKIPVQGHFGEKDELVGFSSPADFNPLRDRLIASKVPFEMFTYPTGHAFTNPSNPNYSKDIAHLALTRMMTFMNQHLA